MFAEDEARLLLDNATSPTHLTAMIERRVAGEPLEQILGWVAFCGLRIDMAPGVFVPRQRTEFLVRHAAELTPPHAVVVDMCCGSGALGIALATLTGPTPLAELHAADLDPAAVACARRNLALVTCPATTYEGDLFAALPIGLRGRIDILVANVPYVPTADIAMLPPEARDHEHRIALDGGPDGLTVARRLLTEAPAWLAAGGRVLFEIHHRQAPAARRAAEEAGLTADTTDDEWGTSILTAALTRR